MSATLSDIAEILPIPSSWSGVGDEVTDFEIDEILRIKLVYSISIQIF
jgi:hypothetical protein